MVDQLRSRRVSAALITLVLSATFAWSHVADATERPRRPQAAASLVLSGSASSPQGAPVPSDWLDAFNHYRAMAGLPEVSESSELYEGVTWSEGGRQHAIWMVKNQEITHYPADNTPFWTEASDAAAANGNIMVTGNYSETARQAIEGWITAPFHAIGMLDPNLTETGYGQYREKRSGYQYGATVDVIRGLGASPAPGVTFPIMFPGNGETVYLDRYPGGEQPDPLATSGCSNYVEPTGLPIYLLLEDEEELVDTSFKRGTTELDHCAYDDDGYTGNVEPGDQGMQGRNAIFLIPKKPLTSEKTFEVSITTDVDTYTWSFETGDVKAPTSKVVKLAQGNAYPKKKLRSMKGTASGDSERVNVALAGVTNLASWKCRYLKANGAFSSQRSCFDQLWVKAKGTKDWSRSFGRTLSPSGSTKEFKQYMAFSQAIDEVGNVQRDPDIKADGNAFHVIP